MRIKNIGRTQPKVINTGAIQSKVNSNLVSKALSAEYIASVGTNPHNLALPKSLQESLIQTTTKKINSENESELVLMGTN
ncbi:MAG: hypothetical protein WAQ98_29780 [Blastocatellia bacterium]